MIASPPATRQAAGRVGEVVLDVDDDEGGARLVALHGGKRSPAPSGVVCTPDRRSASQRFPTATFGPGDDGLRFGVMYFDEFKHQLPDIDPAETDDWLDLARPGRRAGGRDPGPVPHLQAAQAGPPAPGRAAAADPDPLHQHDQPGAGAVLPGRRGDGAADPPAHPLERGGDGPAREQPVRRASAATSRRTPPRRRCTRSASTTSSAARTARAAATRSSTRATPPRASTPGRSSRAA